MYTTGEALQWYDPALLFPSCPLGGGVNGDDGSVEASQASSTSRFSSGVYAVPYGFSQDGRGGNPDAAAYASPAALNRRVQRRARELLLDRLSGDTLSSDRDTAASVSALVQSLHHGVPVELTATSKPQPQTTRSTCHSNPLTESTPRPTSSSLPASLSGATSQSDRQRRRRRRHVGDLSPLHLLDADSAGDGLNDLFGSDSENGEYYTEDGEGLDDFRDGDDDIDDDDLSPGGWSGLRGGNARADGATAAAAAAAHVRDLRSDFMSLPSQLGILEEPVLCPLNLQTDPLAHVVAAAEVFAVVTSTVPQVLYVFDQLNNLPISSTVLGGTSYTAAGSSSSGNNGEAKQTSFCGAARAAYSPSTTVCVVTSCTVDVSDAVRQLWMDPSGHYCVVAFVSGKCVYYYIPRRPSATAAAATSSGSTSADKKAMNSDVRQDQSDNDDGSDSKRRRQERHKEWKEAARRWLRLSRRRRSSSDGDGDGAGEVDGADGVQDSDAAYRPRGFSLTHILPRSSTVSSAAPPVGETAASRSPHSKASSPSRSTRLAGAGFAPACVGWVQHIGAAPQNSSTAFTSVTAAKADTASPRSILKTRERPRPSSSSSSSAFASTASATAVEVLLGAQQGGSLLACVLTPTGAVDSRVVFQFPLPLAQAPLDSVVAVCVSSAPQYGDDAAGRGGVDGDDGSHTGIDGNATGGGAQGGLVGISRSSARHVRWGTGAPPPGYRDCGVGSSSRGPSAFPEYTHTPHFLSTDAERRSDEDRLWGSPSTALSYGGRGPGDVHTSFAPRRRRWVVLISLRNRLYVFSTPSTTTYFSELEEIRGTSLIAGGALAAAGAAVTVKGGDGASGTTSGTPPLLIRSMLEAAAHLLTGRVDDAFVLYTSSSVGSCVDDAHGDQGGDPRRTTLTATALPSPPSPSAKPPRPPAAADDTVHAASTPLTADRLLNFITIESAALSEYSCAGYTAGASEVRTVPPDVTTSMPTSTLNDAQATPEKSSTTASHSGTAASTRAKKHSALHGVSVASPAAPFLLQSRTCGTLHLVLPPSPMTPACGTAATGQRNVPSSQCSLVTPAALPPVFYWQYGDVVVQGLILCGAGGLDVGAKVRELVHRDMRAFTRVAVQAQEAHTGSPHRGDAAVAESASSVPGLETGLAAIVDDALRDMQDLNMFARASTAGEGDTATNDSRVGGGQGDHAALPLPFSTMSESGPTGSLTGAPTSTKALRTPSFTPPAVLPIGILSVTNINSCLQSLRELLEWVSLTRRKGRVAERSGGGQSRGLTYTRCTVRTTTSLTSPLRKNPNGNEGGTRSGLAGVTSKEEAEALQQASVTAALRHPLLQFPWTTRLQLHGHAKNSLNGSSMEANGAAAGRHKRHHRHRHAPHHHRRQPSSLQRTDSTSREAAVNVLNDGAVATATRAAALREVQSMTQGSCSPPLSALHDASLDVPLLSSALARGDVDAVTVSRLRAVACAYVRRAPVLFDVPVESVLRATAAATTALPTPSSPSHTPSEGNPSAAADLSSRPHALHQLSTVQCSATTAQRWADVPVPAAAGNVDGSNFTAHSRSSSAGQAIRRAHSAVSMADFAESNSGGGRGQRGNRLFVVSSTCRKDGDAAGISRADHLRVDGATATPGTLQAEGEEAAGVVLAPQGELLVSMSASYSHIVFATTQGVYVVAHAAVLPLVEAALSWRCELVYHAVTARVSTASQSPPAGAPLFTVVADSGAPDMFYLASRTRMVRLQASSLRSSAAARKQFVLQLLAKASATQQSGMHVSLSGSSSSLLRRADAAPNLKDTIHSMDCNTGSGGGTAGQRLAAAMAEAVNSAAGATETVVVPSSLAYEGRLKAWLQRRKEGARSFDAAGSAERRHGSLHESDYDDDDDNCLGYQLGGHHGSAERESVSWRSSHPSHSSSAQRRRPAYSNAGASTGGARSETQSVRPSSPLSSVRATRPIDLKHPAHATTTIAVTSSTAAAPSRTDDHEPQTQSDSEGQLPRAQSSTAVSHLRAPMGGVQHFLRHANRRAVLPSMAGAASLLPSDSAGFSRSPSTQFTDETATRLQHLAANAAVVVMPAGGSDDEESGTSVVKAAAGSHPLHRSPLSATMVHPLHMQSSNLLTHYASPLMPPAMAAAPSSPSAAQLLSKAGELPSTAGANSLSWRGQARLITNSKDTSTASSAGAAVPATVTASGAASQAEDRELASFLAANPLLHFLLQRSVAANRAVERGGASTEVSSVAATRPHKLSSSLSAVSVHAAPLVECTRAVNIPCFGLLPGSVGLTPLTHLTSRTAASLLLQRPFGAAYYCTDHLYELALAAAACAAHDEASPTQSRRLVVTHEDGSLLGLVRHAYGGFLLSQQRFLEAAVQFGKAADGPTPFTTVFIELVRAFREHNSLEPLALFLRLRLRSMEESAQGLGGHGMAVSVLATWLLSLQLEQCSIARSQRHCYEVHSEGARGFTRSSHRNGAATGVVESDTGFSATSVDFTRVALIRRRYHLDHPAALLEDVLLRYSRFVDWAVLSTSVARLAAAQEAVLVSELQGSPDKTVMSLVLREQNYFAGLLRLQALLADPTSQSTQTRHLLQSLIGADDKGVAVAACLTAPGTMPLVTAFYGVAPSAASSGSDGGASLPGPRDAAGLPRTLASLFEHLAKLFLCCYPCRFVQEGLLALLHQRQDVQLPPRRLLPALLTYTIANNESVFEATGPPVAVLRALAMARRAQQQQQLCAALAVPVQKKGKKTRMAKPDEKVAHTLGTEGPPQLVPPADTAVMQSETLPDDEDVVKGRSDPMQRSQSHHHEGSEVADSISLSSHNSSSSAANDVVDPSLPPSFHSLSSSSSSLTLARGVSHHETRTYDPNNYSCMNSTAPPPGDAPQQPEESGSETHDRIVLRDSSSEGSDVDEDIVLPDLPDQLLPLTSQLHETQSNTSSSPSSSSSTVTPSSPPRVSRGGVDAPSDAEASGMKNESDVGSSLSLLRSDSSSASAAEAADAVGSVASSATASSPSVTNCESHTGVRSGSSDVSGKQRRSTDKGKDTERGAEATTAEAAQIFCRDHQDSTPLQSNSAASSSSSSPSSTTAMTPTTTATSSSDVAGGLHASSESSNTATTEDSEQDADEEEGEEEGEGEEFSDFCSDDLSLPMGIPGGSFMEVGDAAFCSNDTETRIHTRMQRAREKRVAAELQLRHALTPPLTHAIVVAAVAHESCTGGTRQSTERRDNRKDNDNDSVSGVSVGVSGGGHGNVTDDNDDDDNLHPVPQHAVLCYLEDLVKHSGVPGSDFDGADAALFVAYANILARDGEEEALQRFTERVALHHLRETDTHGSSASSVYRLLHVLRLCRMHRRWVGCVWMYFALRYDRDAVQLALRCVVGEQGVRLAVRLLQLLHERDRQHDQAARRRERGYLAAPQTTPGAVPGRSGLGDEAGGSAYTQQQEVRRSRRELWMLVARHLIQGGGHTKHGAQTALQLSLRSGGDSFNITDVLPELPDTLFMAELKDELLRSVRELSHTMRGLRANTNALGRDTRVLHRELQLMSHQPLSMQVDERCVLCGQPALARPFTVYPRCRHLIHTSCYHHARQAMQRRVYDEKRVDQQRTALVGSSSITPTSTSSLAVPQLQPSKVVAAASLHGSENGAGSSPLPNGPNTTTVMDVSGLPRAVETSVDSMECLLCARRYLRAMLSAPLHLSFVGDDARQPERRALLR
jgi:hypothetical protein